MLDPLTQVMNVLDPTGTLHLAHANTLEAGEVSVEYFPSAADEHHGYTGRLVEENAHYLVLDVDGYEMTFSKDRVLITRAADIPDDEPPC